MDTSSSGKDPSKDKDKDTENGASIPPDIANTALVSTESTLAPDVVSSVVEKVTVVETPVVLPMLLDLDGNPYDDLDYAYQSQLFRAPVSFSASGFNAAGSVNLQAAVASGSMLGVLRAYGHVRGGSVSASAGYSRVVKDVSVSAVEAGGMIETLRLRLQRAQNSGTI